MTDEDRPIPINAWRWSRGNLAAIAVLTTLLVGLGGWRIARNRARLAEDLTVSPAAIQPAAEKIDPNICGWASLARLGGVGPGKAKAICRWRDAFTAANPGKPAFSRPEDLLQVKGIGTQTVKAIAPYLAFASR